MCIEGAGKPLHGGIGSLVFLTRIGGEEKAGEVVVAIHALGRIKGHAREISVGTGGIRRWIY